VIYDSERPLVLFMILVGGPIIGYSIGMAALLLNRALQ
jgi:hypothetical protein